MSVVDNPFLEMKGIAVAANKARDYFITPAEAVKVLEACPNAEWRLIFALSRFAGLRCPSEHLALKRGDIDGENSKIPVFSAVFECCKATARPVSIKLGIFYYFF